MRTRGPSCSLRAQHAAYRMGTDASCATLYQRHDMQTIRWEMRSMLLDGQARCGAKDNQADLCRDSKQDETGADRTVIGVVLRDKRERQIPDRVTS